MNGACPCSSHGRGRSCSYQTTSSVAAPSVSASFGILVRPVCGPAKRAGPTISMLSSAVFPSTTALPNLSRASTSRRTDCETCGEWRVVVVVVEETVMDTRKRRRRRYSGHLGKDRGEAEVEKAELLL